MQLDKVRLGMAAQHVLESEAMQAVAKDIKDMLYKEFEQAEDTEEGDKRAKALRAEARAMSEIRSRLKRMVDEGKVERLRQAEAEASDNEGEAA